MGTPIKLTTAVEAVIAEHGGARKAGRALGVDFAYLLRLKSGEKSNPTEEMLKKLRLRRVVTYEQL